MILKERIALMSRLGQYFLDNNDDWKAVKEEAFLQNPWFLPEYIDLAVHQISTAYLQSELLAEWVAPFSSFSGNRTNPEVGIVMAGNIPLVGFHDFLSVFISGCRQRIKLSSKDNALWKAIFKLLKEWNSDVENLVVFTDQLKNCDGYIATGSNNSARFFDYYFAKYPHIIRRNRSSAAVLTGNESPETLSLLADDLCLYFGLGCRNVTKILIPEHYDFEPLKDALKKYAHHLSYPKYKNNYDYQLALILLNKLAFKPADPVLFVPSDSLFAPISVVHYQEYKSVEERDSLLPKEEETQCIITGAETKISFRITLPFGTAQYPSLSDFADQENTLVFLNKLKNK